MTKITSSRALDSTFNADVHLDVADAMSFYAESDIRPIVIFIIPGIQSDKLWAHRLRIYSSSYVSREIHTYVVGDELTLIDLLFRFRIRFIHSDFLEQINDIIEIHSNSDICFLCHSMGSAIFGEIIEKIYTHVTKSSGNRITNIVFIGSVCHRSFAKKIRGACVCFVNDVGLRDFLPLAANVVRPFKYGAVGRIGFSKTYAHDRFFTDHDHHTCTSEEYISEWIIPILEEGIVKESQDKVRSIGYNRFYCIRFTIWFTVAMITSSVVYFGFL